MIFPLFSTCYLKWVTFKMVYRETTFIIIDVKKRYDIKKYIEIGLLGIFVQQQMKRAENKNLSRFRLTVKHKRREAITKTLEN